MRVADVDISVSGIRIAFSSPLRKKTNFVLDTCTDSNYSASFFLFASGCLPRPVANEISWRQLRGDMFDLIARQTPRSGVYCRSFCSKELAKERGAQLEAAGFWLYVIRDSRNAKVVKAYERPPSPVENFFASLSRGR
jgi:hypothetical protein